MRERRERFEPREEFLKMVGVRGRGRGRVGGSRGRVRATAGASRGARGAVWDDWD